LALWQDSITSNIAATASAAHAAEMHQAEFHYQTHAIDFLSYSYLQSGQEAKARELIEHTSHVVGASEEDKPIIAPILPRGLRSSCTVGRSSRLAASSDPQETGVDTTYWARAIGAARSGDVPGAESDVKELTQLVAEREKRSKRAATPSPPKRARNLREAEAWLAFAKGKSDEALQGAACRSRPSGQKWREIRWHPGARNARGHAPRTQASGRSHRRIQDGPQEFAEPL